VPAPVRAAIAAVDEVTFGHHPIAFFHVKVFSFFQAIRITIAVSKNIVKNAHLLYFLQSYILSLFIRCLSLTAISGKMGFERDFLMRQLMMLFEVIARIIRLRKNGQNENAREEIDYFYRCLAVDTDFVSMPAEEMMKYLTAEKKLTNEHLELIAFVLKEQGEIAENESEKLAYFSKSWFLLDKVERESTAFSVERQLRMAELRAFLDLN
jgi:hypothetical protein